MSTTNVRDAVRQKYGELAKAAGTGGCGPAACGCGDPITSNLYSQDEKDGLPRAAVAASLGCGNPTALLKLEAGQIVLHLGPGGGLHLLLSAQRAGPTRKGDWLHSTDAMLALSRGNQTQSGPNHSAVL